MSESGFSGFKDLQDVIEILFLGSGDFGKLGYFTALPDVMRYKNPTPNPLPASDEGAKMYLIRAETAVKVLFYALL
ncbi:MAG: hypothetical protein EZY12_03635 [Dolichospermum sp. DET69]|nr:hypothetical protein [Dolichospermum sp. DET66]MBS3031554.1 hypothetical protein [Dolichospermum sp. DET67]QSX68794.1 MAG: hypothetical protein EZY12_03635 [Dolichospermum sp. DET69]